MELSPARATTAIFVFAACCLSSSCGRKEAAPSAGVQAVVTVGTVRVTARPMAQHLTISSELVPFQQIDVYAKEAGYVKELNVDYGSHVRKGQVMAVLEVPELQAQLDEDNAAIRAQQDEIKRAQNEVDRAKTQRDVLHVQYERLAGVAKTQAGLVAQQEVDDLQGRDLAAASQLEAVRGAFGAAQSQLAAAQAKLRRDQAMFDYSKITAPFDGVVTQRFANLGALMQAGTTSTQATPLVRLSDESLFRLVIPVPESDIKYVAAGDAVEVRIPALNKVVHGKVQRFSVDVSGNTRTMHTEVDLPNPDGKLVAGVYAEAVLAMNQRNNVLTVPPQAITRAADKASVFVVKSDNRVEERPITLGTQTPDYIEVASGLAEGDRVVVSDRSELKTGDVVKPKQVETMAYEGSGQ